MNTLIALALLAQASPEYLAVLELSGQGLSEAERKSLSEVFTEEVAHHFDGRVYSNHEILQMVLREERVQRLETCDDTGCLAEIALALGAEHMIQGSISRLGDTVTMTVSLIDARDAQVTGRASLDWAGSPEGLADATRALAQGLMLAPADQRPGVLRFSPETPGAVVRVDGRTFGVSPLLEARGLTVGVHQLVVEADGYAPLSREVVVLHGRDSVVDIHLEAAEGRPLYAKWWFWAIAGGVAVGAATTAAVLATQNDEPEPSTGIVDIRWSLR